MIDLRVKSVVRSKFIHMDDMTTRDDRRQVLPQFQDVFVNMTRNKIAIDVEIEIDDYNPTMDFEPVQFGDDLVDFCDKHCKGLWSRIDKDPEEILPTRRNPVSSYDRRKFKAKLIILFEYPEDADYFMSHFVLIQKLAN